jgi:hypothetical protein
MDRGGAARAGAGHVLLSRPAIGPRAPTAARVTMAMVQLHRAARWRPTPAVEHLAHLRGARDSGVKGFWMKAISASIRPCRSTP